jgi:hypothetical protein
VVYLLKKNMQTKIKKLDADATSLCNGKVVLKKTRQEQYAN